MSIQKYLDGIELQHRKPRFLATLTSLLEKVDAVENVINKLPSDFVIEKAAGRQLDIIGETLGVTRAFPFIDGTEPSEMTDDVYRKVLMLKVASNNWDGTFGGFKRIWDSVFDGYTITSDYKDNQDMSVDVSVSGDVSDDLEKLLLLGTLFPRPMGVGYNITVSSQTERTASASVNSAMAMIANYSELTVIAT